MRGTSKESYFVIKAGWADARRHVPCRLGHGDGPGLLLRATPNLVLAQIGGAIVTRTRMSDLARTP
jgi:hypothetical protein